MMHQLSDSNLLVSTELLGFFFFFWLLILNVCRVYTFTKLNWVRKMAFASVLLVDGER